MDRYEKEKLMTKIVENMSSVFSLPIEEWFTDEFFNRLDELAKINDPMGIAKQTYTFHLEYKNNNVIYKKYILHICSRGTTKHISYRRVM